MSYNISYILKGINSSSKPETIEEGNPLLITLSVLSGFSNEFINVKILMSDLVITADVYNKSTKEINIPSVTGNVIIYAGSAFNLNLAKNNLYELNVNYSLMVNAGKDSNIISYTGASGSAILDKFLLPETSPTSFKVYFT